MEQLIAGNLFPRPFWRPGSQAQLASAKWKRLVADAIRLGTGAALGMIVARGFGECDLVYERFAALQRLGAGLQARGVPWILESNGLFYLESEADRRSAGVTALARRLEHQAYQECDVLVTISESLKSMIVEHARVDERKIIVVPNAVRLPPRPKHAWMEHAPLRIVYVGTLIDWQNLGTLVRATAELKRRRCAVEVVLAGSGPASETLVAEVAALGIQDRVTLTGQLSPDEVSEAILGADLGYSGQIDMAFGRMYHSPLKLYEYMGHGVPPVVTRHEDAQRLCSEGVTGFFFDGTTRGLVEVIERIVRERPALPDVGRAGRHLIERYHTWDARVAQLLRQASCLIGRQL